MNTRARITVIIPALVAAIVVIVLLVRLFTPDVQVVTGMVDCTTVDVAAKIPGRVDSLCAHEGEQVQTGTLLARLEGKEMDAKVGQARSAMAAARAKLDMALAGARVEERDAVTRQYEQARAQYELAEKTWKRVERVYRDSLVSTQERDQVEFQFTAAREQMDAARAKMTMVNNGARREEIAAATALYEQASNVYKEAMAYFSELDLRSPINGEVSKRIVDKGEIVAGGYPVFTVTDLNDAWVVVQVREDQMPRFRMGAQFNGVVRALGADSHKFGVSYIAPMADFANWKPTNQKGEYDLKTFEVRLRSAQPIDGLRPGMTVQVTL
jgi:HlyD family secretion protein